MQQGRYAEPSVVSWNLYNQVVRVPSMLDTHVAIMTACQMNSHAESSGLVSGTGSLMNAMRISNSELNAQCLCEPPHYSMGNSITSNKQLL